MGSELQLAQWANTRLRFGGEEEGAQLCAPTKSRRIARNDVRYTGDVGYGATLARLEEAAWAIFRADSRRYTQIEERETSAGG